MHSAIPTRFASAGKAGEQHVHLSVWLNTAQGYQGSFGLGVDKDVSGQFLEIAACYRRFKQDESWIEHGLIGKVKVLVILIGVHAREAPSKIFYAFEYASQSICVESR